MSLLRNFKHLAVNNDVHVREIFHQDLGWEYYKKGQFIYFTDIITIIVKQLIFDGILNQPSLYWHIWNINLILNCLSNVSKARSIVYTCSYWRHQKILNLIWFDCVLYLLNWAQKWQTIPSIFFCAFMNKCQICLKIGKFSSPSYRNKHILMFNCALNRGFDSTITRHSLS